MEIGINMDDREYELSDTDELVITLGTDMEVGYLKINPERVPVIEGKNKAEAEFAKMKAHLVEVELLGGRYQMITDDRSIEITPEFIIVEGTAYIGRRQGRKHTALTVDEVEDWLIKLDESYVDHDEMPTDGDFPCIVFEFDSETGTWN